MPVGRKEVEGRAGVDGGHHHLARAVAPGQIRGRQVSRHRRQRHRIGRHVHHAGVDSRSNEGDVLAGNRVGNALAHRFEAPAEPQMGAVLLAVQSRSAMSLLLA